MVGYSKYFLKENEKKVKKEDKDTFCCKLQEEWRWIDGRVLPSIYDINDRLDNQLNNKYRPSYERLVSKDRSSDDFRPFYGRSNSYGTSHMHVVSSHPQLK